MASNQPTDFALWEAIRRDDEQAFVALFDRYWARLFALAFATVKDREACTEIVHDIFLTLWQKRDKLQIDAFLPYLTAATRYQVFRHVRAARAIPLHYSEQCETLATATSRNSADEQFSHHDIEASLLTYLSQLPARCREIFVLSRLQQLSNHEIATRLSISKRTVENQITAALQHLRLTWKDGVWLLLLLLSAHRG
ncbi:RNA polymerase sigma-70 factor [Hymenobacter aerilatus]|uniref:RNA polymerase sigma-70 factor n=1 Tax=Hymenobacter aerilatus TaxID=2932251 RepID=A0A8T9SRC1_9BACT|nr:RNA polymerase sigma-70 factor [Hymenobacter aerilatus]UOR03901.1 RNA polymerase sigma-70 factor [Hymenobacter aerilatus]